jgi:ribosome assembly protein YihI (activator of Der GTPase)
VIPQLIRILKDNNVKNRWKLEYIFEVLGALGAEQAIPDLIMLLADEYAEVRRSAAKALGILRAEQAISELSKALKDTDSRVRKNVAEALGRIGAEQTIPVLLETLKDKDSDVRLSTAITLGQLGSEHAIPELLDALQDKSFFRRYSVADSIENINNVSIARILPHLIELIPTPSGGAAFSAMSVIQSNCKFYNYNIAQLPPPKLSNEHPNRQGMTSMTTYNFDQRGAYIGVNVANEGSIINFVQYANQNIDFSEQDLAEAARKIEALLTQLGQSYPIATEAQQQTFIQKFLERIESTPDLIKVFLAGGIEGLKILCPSAGIPIEIVRCLYEVVRKRHGQS